MKKAKRALKHKNIGIQQHILKNPTLNAKQFTNNYFEFCIPLLDYPQPILPTPTYYAPYTTVVANKLLDTCL